MDTALKKDMYMNYAMLWSGSIGGEAACELVVPDSMPDIGVIVDAEALLTIRSKEADAGRIRATTELSIKVLYQPEDGSALQSLPVSMSCEVSTNVPDADIHCQPVVRLRLRSLDARVINSRKLSLHAALSGQACCLRREEISLVRDIRIPGLRLQTLTQVCHSCIISDVREKTFIVTEDYRLPAGCSAVSAILLQRVLLQNDGCEFVNGKLLFRGKARVFLLLECGEELHPCYFETPFSQIMEIGGQAEPAPEISLMLTGAFFDLPEHDSGQIAAEIHILAQVITREEKELQYIADIYSNQKALLPQVDSSSFCSRMRNIPLSRSLSGSVEAPPDTAAVLYARGSVSNIALEESGISVTVSVKVICRSSDNRYTCASARLTESFELLPADGETLTLSSLTVGDCFASVNGGSLELRVPVQIEAAISGTESIAHVQDVQILEDPLPSRPSATLLFAAAGSDLWALAKAHGSTCDAIRKANEGREEGLLLIPKAR